MADSEERPLPTAAGPSNAGSTPAAVETTPLLAKRADELTPLYDDDDDDASIHAQLLGEGLSVPSTKQVNRWPTAIAILLLSFAVVGILLGVHIAPPAVEEYAKQAAVVEPTNLSLESITTDGVRVRIQANFRLDGSKVADDNVRRIGKAATSIARKLSTESTTVDVFLPDYGNVLVGSAVIPPLTVSIVEGHTTAVDIVAEIIPGDANSIRIIANEWLEGRLDSLQVQGKADITLKAGVIPLGTFPVSESLVFEANDLPSIPQYSIDRVNFEEVRTPGNDGTAMGVEVLISAFNEFPFELDIPRLGFEILVPNCNPDDPSILVADAVTEPVTVRPQTLVVVEVNGTIKGLPESLTEHCPGSDSSPLDTLLKQYMSGDDATVFVRGKRDFLGTPDWLSEILASVTLPIPFPGHSFDNLIRNFSLADVRFGLPDPEADPGDPNSNPTVSGTIVVVAGLPSEMNFALNVTKVRADADVRYHDKKLGNLNLHKWQSANSTMHEATKDHEATLTIQSHIVEAPLNVTDADVLAEIIQKMFVGGMAVNLSIDALVDIRVDTVLGNFTLKDIPASGDVPIKPLPGGGLDDLAPQVDSIRILGTSPTSLTLETLVNVTNPTEYTAYIPSICIHVLCNNTIIGTGRAMNLDIKTGNNTNIPVTAVWEPSLGGKHGAQVGRDLLSQYISGLNTTITVKAFRDSIPNQPVLGDALSKFNFSLPTPRLPLPNLGDGGGDDGDEKNEHSFIRTATFHMFSSTASFGLVSPLEDSTLYIESIHAMALYNHTEPVGTIDSDTTFAVPPGFSETKKLPVEWSPDSVGFDKVRKALGGELKLDAEAVVAVRLGTWRETISYVGQGIGARIRP